MFCYYIVRGSQLAATNYLVALNNMDLIKTGFLNKLCSYQSEAPRNGSLVFYYYYASPNGRASSYATVYQYKG